MTVTDLIAVVLSFLALLYLSVRRSREERRRREHPEEYAHEEQEEKKAMRQLLASLELPIPEELQTEDVPEEAKHPPPPPPSEKGKRPSRPTSATTQRTVRHNFRFQSALERVRKKNPIAQRQYESKVGESSKKFGAGIVSSEIGVGPSTDAYEIADTLIKDAYAVQPVSTNAYQISAGQRSSRVQLLMRSRKSKRDMVVLREVLGPAHGLQKPQSSLPLPWEG